MLICAGDGMSNLLEFVLRADPQDITSRGSFTHTTTEAGSVLNFVKAKEVGDYVTTVKWSDDLVTWSAAGVVMEESDLNPDEIAVSVTIPLTSSGGRYFRIEVTGP